MDAYKTARNRSQIISLISTLYIVELLAKFNMYFFNIEH